MKTLLIKLWALIAFFLVIMLGLSILAHYPCVSGEEWKQLASIIIEDTVELKCVQTIQNPKEIMILENS